MTLEDERTIFEGLQMKPLNYFELIVKMPNKADKFDLRLRMLNHAVACGIKPAARVFNTTAKTVRKWLRRYQQSRCIGTGRTQRAAQNPVTLPTQDFIGNGTKNR